MSWNIALLLAQDGITVGAVYALLAVSLVLVFTVTRILFLPQGEFVSYGALTLAALQTGQLPHTVWLLAVLALAAGALELSGAIRRGEAIAGVKRAASIVAMPFVLCLLIAYLAPLKLPLWASAVLSVAVVVPIGTLIYRLAYEPLEHASVLVLLIASVGVHIALTGLGLAMFGAEGSRTPAFSDFQGWLGPMMISGQSIAILASAFAIMVGLSLFFTRTLSGKALRATAINRTGARLLAIRTSNAGRLAMGLAAAIGAFSGVLVAPLTTIYYDSGFLFGLKGFIAAVVGGLVSYPLAAAGAIAVGLLEAYAAFETSALKEVLVFTLILPVLLLRSLTHRSHDGEQSN